MDEQQQPVESVPEVQPATPVPTPPVPDPIPAPIPPPMPVPPPAPAPPAPAPQAPQPPVPTPAPPIDLSGNKGMAILAYLGPLILVPFLTEAKNDPFVKFHLKQGLSIIVTGIAYWIISSILYSAIMPSMYGTGFYRYGASWGVYSILALVLSLVGWGILVIAIIGIINAVTGKQKELPIIGQFARNFNF